MLKKFFSRILTTMIIFGSVITASPVNAEVKIYEGDGEYYMTDETLDVAKEQAKKEAVRNLSEQIFVYVKSESESRDSALENDEVETITENYIKIIDVKYKIEVGEKDEFIVKAKIKAEIDTEDVKNFIEKNERERTKKNK